MSLRIIHNLINNIHPDTNCKHGFQHFSGIYKNDIWPTKNTIDKKIQLQKFHDRNVKGSILKWVRGPAGLGCTKLG